MSLEDLTQPSPDLSPAPDLPRSAGAPTPWVWLLALLPLVSIPALLAIEWSEDVPSSIARGDWPPNPRVVAAAALAGAACLTAVLLAWADWRRLRQRIGRTTSWTWSLACILTAALFLVPSGAMIYVVGRSSSAAARTGLPSRGLLVLAGVSAALPLVVWLGVAIAVLIYWRLFQGVRSMMDPAALPA